MKNILILNGAPRKDGNTAELIRAFCEGAAENGNLIREFYLQDMNIRGCMGCCACHRNGGKCVQQDDMQTIYEAYTWADVIVFASPIYFNFITGTLKTAVDRLFAMTHDRMTPFLKECALLVTAKSLSFGPTLTWYDMFPKACKWHDYGRVLGAGSAFGLGKVSDPESEEEARSLGRHIQ